MANTVKRVYFVGENVYPRKSAQNQFMVPETVTFWDIPIAPTMDIVSIALTTGGKDVLQVPHHLHVINL